MADIPFLQLSDNWRLASDPLQWVIQRQGSFDPKTGERRWNAVSFVATRRDILFRVLRELGAEINPDAQAALDDLPQMFRDGGRNTPGMPPGSVLRAALARSRVTPLPAVVRRHDGAKTAKLGRLA